MYPERQYNERLILDLLRGGGRLIGGDLNIDKECSEQNDRNFAITTPRLRWLPTWAHIN
jgi:hypothetical protein